MISFVSHSRADTLALLGGVFASAGLFSNSQYTNPPGSTVAPPECPLADSPNMRRHMSDQYYDRSRIAW